GVNQTKESIKDAEAAIAVTHVYKNQNRIQLKNIGGTNLTVSSLVVYVNSTKTTTNPEGCGTVLTPGQKCNLTTGSGLESGVLEITGTHGTWDRLNLTGM
ncbi:MAG: hypothetical protein ABEJ72_01360, partial [Candidatus Aenigmatarchaeota archaeon]